MAVKDKLLAKITSSYKNLYWSKVGSANIEKRDMKSYCTKQLQWISAHYKSDFHAQPHNKNHTTTMRWAQLQYVVIYLGHSLPCDISNHTLLLMGELVSDTQCACMVRLPNRDICFRRFMLHARIACLSIMHVRTIFM
jgi:hypothetical protein